MITLCVDGRQPLFGHLEGDIRAKREGADFPHIVLSSLGRTILNEELPKIHHFYPQIELWKAVIMPDHIHLLLYFEACARGSLLILAPWRLDEEIGRGEKTALESAGTTATAGTTTDYARFHRLNDLAEEICNTTDAVLLDIGAIR